ncbi:extracellular catalytic domain type 2 short-chain-length polyhydroxyalkanoate depolymerase [Rhodovulum sp. DZ06]|uniref:extracellular catalytic domain type 2 short-chain-length polyhydroxyalkanoate depolymerase n=1 Tax=Rhodovulum sp. DZ06 TaxID=3425126 RepID=UPI003D32C163
MRPHAAAALACLAAQPLVAPSLVAPALFAPPLVALALAAPASAETPLPALSLEPGVTVSGLSSGAYMTVQVQTAFSSRITGAGVVAGGVYGCANGWPNRALVALQKCMAQTIGAPTAAGAEAEVAAMAAGGHIDDPAGLLDDRVYLYHGESDETVHRPAMDALDAYYEAIGIPDAAANYVTDIDSGHAFLTPRGDVPCATTEPDFLNDCDVAGADVDQAHDILAHLLGPLDPAGTPDPDRLLEFDQALYTGGAIGMDPKAYAYIPEACESGETCRLHIAFHGCKQGRSWPFASADGDVMGSRYPRLTGYNRWAESNRIVVLYPQAMAFPSSFLNLYNGNPDGCWDWWGYSDAQFAWWDVSGAGYLAKDAPQLAAIAAMAAALGAPLTE